MVKTKEGVLTRERLGLEGIVVINLICQRKKLGAYDFFFFFILMM